MAVVEDAPEVVEEVLAEGATVEAGAESPSGTDGATCDGPTMSELEAAHYAEIRELELEVREAANEMNATKRVASMAKKKFEALDEELRGLIARGPNPQLQLSLEEESQEQDSKAAKYEQLLDTLIEDVLELTEKQHEKLLDCGVDTVGDFEKLRGGQMPDFPRGLRDVKGVGEKTIDKWEDAIVNWLAKAETQEEATDAPEPGDVIDAEWEDEDDDDTA